MSLPFSIGEQLVFHIYYGFIGAGIAYVELPQVVEIREKPAYHFIASGKTNRFFSLIFRVDDRIESFVDTASFSTLRYEKHLREGTYKKDDFANFYPEKGYVEYADGDSVELADNALDVAGIFYLIRQWDFKVGDTLTVKLHVDKENWTLRIYVEKKGSIKSGIGEKSAYLLRLLVKESKEFKGKSGLESIFGSEGGLEVWLSADEKKIPLLISTKVFFGSVRAVLQEVRR